jgi:phage terminase small subunit
MTGETKRKRLTQKQETFCLNVFQGMSQREAYLKAGYSANMALSVIDVKASELANHGKVSVRIQELRQKAEDATIADVKERKQILTEIARANMTNFVEVGQDGAWFNIDETNLNNRAIQSVQSKTVLGKDGADDAVFIRVSLHDPTKAIDLLNKMDKLYAEGVPVNIDNRQVNIYVIDSETKTLISRVGERTKLLNNGHEDDQSIQGGSGSMGSGQETH